MEKMMRMKNERCKLKNNNKFNKKNYMFYIIILLSLVFLPGAYYEKNIYYKLDDIELEIGEKIPQKVYNNLLLLGDKNYNLESNIPLNNHKETTKIGKYTYHLIYNDTYRKISIPTNISATIEVKDTVSPTIKLKNNKIFKYNSKITPEDIAICEDLSICTLNFQDKINTNISGEKNIKIIAIDEGNNKNVIETKILIEEKPKPKYNFYYPSNINYINNANNQKNSLLSEEEKNNLRNQIVSYSMNFIGNPYVYGGTSLTNGTDCSGFTMSIYNHFGYLLPRIAVSQIFVGKNIQRNNLLPGDLIVYHYGHVGIYVGDNMMIHAGTTQTGIVMAPIFEGTKSYKRIIY